MAKLIILGLLLAFSNVAAPESRIVAGETAAPGQFPFMVSIRMPELHICGGSIIKEGWVLTAAHCVYRQLPRSFFVVAGSNQLISGGVKYAVSSIITHERYSPFWQGNDIALLKLATSIGFTDLMKPIPLETHFNWNSKVTLVGWGKNGAGVVPNELQFAPFNTISNFYCRLRFFFSVRIYSSDICIKGTRGRSACFGDSGSPLVGANGKQVGIVSRGLICGAFFPDVMTRVSSFNGWIQSRLSLY